MTAPTTLRAQEAARHATVDASEIDRFSAMADEWWDPGGKFRPLHRFNPARLAYIRDHVCRRFGRDTRSLRPLDGLRLLDVGCGGGLISEPLARLGATVTGIDASDTNIAVATEHAARDEVPVDYRAATAEELAAAGETFDVVLSLEVVEHVADVDLFIDRCCDLVAPEGVIILATLNRTLKGFLFGIVGAEYVLRWLPRGTHRWDRFVRPSELARALRRNGIAVRDISGMSYDLLADEWRRSRDTSVNYMVFAERS